MPPRLPVYRAQCRHLRPPVRHITTAPSHALINTDTTIHSHPQSSSLRHQSLQRLSLRLAHRTRSTSPTQNQRRTIRSIARKPLASSPFNNPPNLPPLGASPSAAFLRKLPALPRRPGALAIKKGMTTFFLDKSSSGGGGGGDEIKQQPATVLQLDRVEIVGHKTMEQHGYWACQIGEGSQVSRRVTRPMLGVWASRGVPPKREVVEFRVAGEEGLGAIGQKIEADWWRVGDWVDVQSRCKGKGFAGGMKRHGWKGQPASHGNSKNHRTMGSSGGGQGSGSRVHPGKEMAGNMGGNFHTVQNLQVLQVDRENGIVVVSGPVPGPNKSTVRIRDASKKPWPDVPSPLQMAATASASASKATAAGVPASSTTTTVAEVQA